MNRTELFQLVQQTSKSGVLLDTNMLLLRIIGWHDPTEVERHRRTSPYFTRRDWQLLDQILSRFFSHATLPHVLTEVSNLLSAGAQQLWLAREVPNLAEKSVSANTLVATPDFARLGLADTAILDAGQSKPLVVTNDKHLYLALARAGCPVLNWNHLVFPA